jgi:hypothetical protein
VTFGAPEWPEIGPRRHGPGLQVYPLKHKSQSKFPHYFAKKPLCFSKINPRSSLADFEKKPIYFSEINPWSVIFSVRSKIRKIFTKRSLASEKSTKIAPKLQKFISFQPQL